MTKKLTTIQKSLLLVKENVIGKDDIKIAKFIFGILNYGHLIMKTRKNKDYKLWYRRLNKNNYFIGNKLSVEDPNNFGTIDIILMILVCKNFILRSNK